MKMHVMYSIIYILIVLVILLKTYGIIQIIKGFIHKNEKQWVRGFYMVAIAVILFVTTLAYGIHGCPVFKKCNMRNGCPEYRMRDDGFRMDCRAMHHCKMHCMEMNGEFCKQHKGDTVAFIEKKIICKEHK